MKRQRRFARIVKSEQVDGDAATLSITLTVRGDTRKALEALGTESLRPMFADALVSSIAKASAFAVTPSGEASPARVFKRAIVSKAEEERYVLGVVMEPDAVDTQGHTETAETIRKAAYKFLEAYRGGGDQGHMGLMHKEMVDGKVAILESYIQKSDETMGEEVIKAGSWLMAVRVMDDKMWEGCKAGDLTGFSIGGTAVEEPVA